MVDMITKNDVNVYVDEVESLPQWCLANNLFLNVNMAGCECHKGTTQGTLSGTAVESVRTFRYLVYT